MDNQILIQSLGIIAMITMVIAPQFKNRKHVILMFILCNSLWIAHLYMLGATYASFNLCFAILSLIISYYHKDIVEKNKPVVALLLLQPVVSAFFFWEGAITIAGLFASLFGRYSGLQKDPQKIRIYLAVCAVFWIIYDYYYASYPGMAAEIFTLSSALIALWRYRKKPTPAEEKITTS